MIRLNFGPYIRELRLKLAIAKADYLDRRLGIDPGDDLADNTLYGRLEKMIKYLKPTLNDVFVDLGCGRGRVVFFVAAHKLKKVIGVELDKELFDIAQNNLRNLKINRTPVSLVNIDAANFAVKEETIFYMFNPFGPETLEKVLQNIKESHCPLIREESASYIMPPPNANY